MLNLSSEQFKFFSDNIFALYGTINSDGNLINIEGNFLDSFDIDKNQLVGQDFFEFVVWKTDIQTKKNFREQFNSALEGKKSQISLKFKGKSDEIKYIELTFLPNLIEDSETIYFCANDVSVIQGELNNYKDRCDYFLYAAEIAEVGLWTWNLKNNEIYSTPRCKEIFEVSEDENITFDKILNVLHPDDSENFKENIANSRKNNNEFIIQFRVIHSDGNLSWIHGQGKTVFNEELNAKTLLGSFRNVNDAKAATEELERIYNLEKAAKNEAEQANKTKDFFLALVSHELRSPLNAILGWTNILLKKDIDDKTKKKALETIEKSAKAQAKLIEDLVDSARVTSGKLKLEIRELNLFTVLEGVINSYMPQIKEKGINFEFKHETDQFEVLGDTIRLRQIFANILGNAIKFTPTDGKIFVNQEILNDEIKVTFEDTGQGISEEDLPNIFRRFAQGDENYVKGKAGLGLGLSIAKILVERHEGKIIAESEGIGQGSKFIIKFPRSSANLKNKEKKDKENLDNSEENASGTLNGFKILIVEDDEDSRNVLEIYLNQLGAKIRSADSVKGAFNLLDNEYDELPHLIISDIGMPNEDGYSFIRRIRKSEEYKDLPAIALSAFTAESNKEKAIKLGFQIYHTKPFEPDLLVNEILELIE